MTSEPFDNLPIIPSRSSKPTNDMLSMQVSLYDAIQSFHRELGSVKNEIVAQLRDFTPRTEFTQQTLDIRNRIDGIDAMAKKILDQSNELQRNLDRSQRETNDRITQGDREVETQVLRVQTEAAQARADLERRLGDILASMNFSDRTIERQSFKQQGTLDDRIIQLFFAILIAVGTYLLGHFFK